MRFGGIHPPISLTNKRTLALSISNRISSFRSFYDNEWPPQNFYQKYFVKIREMSVCVGGEYLPSDPSEFQKGHYQFNEPLGSFYDHPFYICLKKQVFLNESKEQY